MLKQIEMSICKYTKEARTSRWDVSTRKQKSLKHCRRRLQPVAGEDLATVGRVAWQMMKWHLQKDICQGGWPQQPEAVLIDRLSETALRWQMAVGLVESTPGSGAMGSSRKVASGPTFGFRANLLNFVRLICVLFLILFFLFFSLARMRLCGRVKKKKRLKPYIDVIINKKID